MLEHEKCAAMNKRHLEYKKNELMAIEKEKEFLAEKYHPDHV